MDIAAVWIRPGDVICYSPAPGMAEAEAQRTAKVLQERFPDALVMQLEPHERIAVLSRAGDDALDGEEDEG